MYSLPGTSMMHSSHSDDNVCGGALSAHFIVHRTRPLVGVVVTPQCQVHLVLLLRVECKP